MSSFCDSGDLVLMTIEMGKYGHSFGLNQSIANTLWKEFGARAFKNSSNSKVVSSIFKNFSFVDVCM